MTELPPELPRTNGQWNLVFLRYGNPEVRWDTGGWVLMDCVFLVNGASRDDAIQNEKGFCDWDQPNPEGVAEPFLPGEMDLHLLGVYDVIPIQDEWANGCCLGEREFSYDMWHQVMDTKIHPDQLVDDVPVVLRPSSASGLRNEALAPPRSQSEMEEQNTKPSWYLVEVSYAVEGVHWTVGGMAVLQRWHAIHADRDSVAFYSALTLAAPSASISRAACDEMGVRCSQLRKLGVSELVPTWDPWCHGAELGYRVFGYDDWISWQSILKEIEPVQSKWGGE